MFALHHAKYVDRIAVFGANAVFNNKNEYRQSLIVLLVEFVLFGIGARDRFILNESSGWLRDGGGTGRGRRIRGRPQRDDVGGVDRAGRGRRRR